jgi:hypothetical protein
MRRPLASIPVLFLGFLSVACGYDNDGKSRVDANTSTPETSYASIDTDAKMENLDSGVGLFITYAAGGTWTLQLACDTATSKRDCGWDVYAYTKEGGRFSSFKEVELESEDLVSVTSDGVAQLKSRTKTDLDGIELVTTAGEPLSFDVVLEGEDYPQDFIFWMSKGAVVKGAETPILELTPTDP